VNGTDSTRFSTDETQFASLHYEVNLGSAQTFNELQMAVPGSPTDYARGYTVEVSPNGTTWTAVATCTGSGTPEIVSFPVQTAQYLEVVLTAGNSSYWWSINQFDVYNTTPVPTTTSTVAPTTTTTVAPTTTTVPVAYGLWTVDVNGSTKYEGCARNSRGFNSVALNDKVTVTGFRAGQNTVDATLVTIKSGSSCSTPKHHKS